MGWKIKRPACFVHVSGADPGFPVVGRHKPHWGWAPTSDTTFFSENVCRNERLGPVWETVAFNNGFHYVVTSIHFVKIRTFFAKLLGFEPTPAGPSVVFSLML